MLSRVSGKTKTRFVAEVTEDQHRLQWPKNAESERSAPGMVPVNLQVYGWEIKLYNIFNYIFIYLYSF